MARKVNVREIEKKVKELCLKANTVLRSDVVKELEASCRKEKNALSRKMLKVLIDNAKIAKEEKLPVCQDTGVAVVFVEVGRDVHIAGDLLKAIDKGVEKAYREGHFRKSIVSDPVKRVNTGTNTPSVVHVDIVKGNKVKISVLPKGFGSENKSVIGMLNPTCTDEDIVNFCVDAVKKAGPDACPPYVLGIGIGGTMDSAALLSKKALLRKVKSKARKKHIEKIEKEILKKANDLGIGVMGLGGKTTVMGVNVLESHTHIAGCPVAVNVCCHALRSASGAI